MADFVVIYKVCARKAIIEAAKKIINFDKVCHSYSDLNFGVTFLEHSVEKVTTALHCNLKVVRRSIISLSALFTRNILH